MVILQANHLNQKYDNQNVVNDVNLTIEQGQLIALLGPNGAGKTTTIKMLTGINQPASGTVTLNGISTKDPNYQRQIGMVFQDSVLDDQLTVKQNLQLRAKMYHQFNSAFLKQLLQWFHVDDILNQKYGTLSGGQRRRIDIIRALLNQPQVLFLDEPTTALDIQTRQQIWEVLARLRQERQMTIVLTTHYLEETEQADYVYVLDHGQVIANDTVANLEHLYSQHILTITTSQPEQVMNNLPLEWQTEVNGQQIKIMVPSTNAAMKFIADHQLLISEMEYHRGDMNDIFIALTGKEIR